MSRHLHLLETLEPRTLFSIASFIATGSTVGGTVTVIETDGTVATSFHPYGNAYTGAVDVAVGDVDGDGTPEIITSPMTQGSSPVVCVFTPAGTRITLFLAYDTSFKGGVRIAAGDLTEDGHDDIVTAAGPGGTPHVRVFNSDTGLVVRNFRAYDNSFHGGVNVAVGDVNNDGTLDIVTGTRASGAPQVRVFNGANQQVIGSFLAYSTSYFMGVQVATADLNGDGFSDIITSTGNGQAASVKSFSGNGFGLLHSVTPFPSSTTGATIGILDADEDGDFDVIVASLTSPNLTLRILKGSDFSTLDTLHPTAPSNSYFVAGYSVPVI
jgi:hypothetical protein